MADVARVAVGTGLFEVGLGQAHCGTDVAGVALPLRAQRRQRARRGVARPQLQALHHLSVRVRHVGRGGGGAGEQHKARRSKRQSPRWLDHAGSQL